jgi:hypothetical protein
MNKTHAAVTNITKDGSTLYRYQMWWLVTVLLMHNYKILLYVECKRNIGDKDAQSFEGWFWLGRRRLYVK